jgi:3-(3-hydroxy-phenyl)propionate hydroxylase
LRKAVLSLARETEFGKRMVNAAGSRCLRSTTRRLSTPDAIRGAAARAGAPCWTRRCARRGEPIYLTDAFSQAGTRFTLLEFSNGAACDAPEA